jgi:hypothetical protein
MGKGNKKSQGRKIREGKRVHQNRYSSESKGEAWLERKLAQESKQAERPKIQPSYSTPQSYRSSSLIDSLFGTGYCSPDSASTLNRLTRPANSSFSRGSLDSGVSDSRSTDFSQVREFGCWWDYEGYKFIRKGLEAGQGFDRDEVPIIKPQLARLDGFRSSGRYRLVTVKDQSFYVDVEDGFVRVVSTEYLDSKNQKQYGVRRTDVASEVLGLR